MRRKSQSGWLECIFMQVEARIVGMLLMPSVPIVISSSTDRSLHFLSSVCTSTRTDPPSVPHLQIVTVLCHNHCKEPLRSLSPSHCNYNSGHRHGFFLPAALVLIAPSIPLLNLSVYTWQQFHPPHHCMAGYKTLSLIFHFAKGNIDNLLKK